MGVRVRNFASERDSSAWSIVMMSLFFDGHRPSRACGLSRPPASLKRRSRARCRFLAIANQPLDQRWRVMSIGRLHIQRSSAYRRVAEMSGSILSCANPVRCVRMPNGNVAIEVHLTARSRQHRSPFWQTWVPANYQRKTSRAGRGYPSSKGAVPSAKLSLLASRVALGLEWPALRTARLAAS